MYVKYGEGEIEALCYTDQRICSLKTCKRWYSTNKLLDQVLQEPDDKLLLNSKLIQIIQYKNEIVQIITKNSRTHVLK